MNADAAPSSCHEAHEMVSTKNMSKAVVLHDPISLPGSVSGKGQLIVMVKVSHGEQHSPTVSLEVVCGTMPPAAL